MNRYERLNQERKMVDMKRKVAAYCRVSTDNEDQANSFESQQRYFKQYIERNPDWEDRKSTRLNSSHEEESR